MRRPTRAVYLADGMSDVRMLEGFARLFDLTVIVPAFLGERACVFPSRVEVRRVSLGGGRAGFLARAAWWLLRNRRGYDAVIVLDNLFAAAAANLACGLARRPVVIQLGRPTEEYFRARRVTGRTTGPAFWAGLAVVRALVAFNERRAAAIGATSEYCARRSERRCRRVAFAPAYGVDPAAYSPGSRSDARAALGLPAGIPLVLFRSRLASEKDPRTFLAAMAILRAERPEAVALYVGGEYREFEAMAAEHGVPVISRNHVHPLTELPDFYRAASVTVQTSHAEGLGLSPLESMACGTPAVVSAVGGLVEVASDGRAALLVPHADAAACARAIAWTLDHPAEAAAMAAAGREYVERELTPETTFETWRRLVEESAGSPAAPLPAAAGR